MDSGYMRWVEFFFLPAFFRGNQRYLNEKYFERVQFRGTVSTSRQSIIGYCTHFPKKRMEQRLALQNSL